MEFSSFRKKYELVIQQYLHSRNVKVAEILAIGQFFMLNHMFLFGIQKFYLFREVLNSLEVSIGRFYWPISSHVRNLGLSVVSNERFKIPLFRQKPKFLKKSRFWNFVERKRLGMNLDWSVWKRSENGIRNCNSGTRQNDRTHSVTTLNDLEWTWTPQNRGCAHCAQMCTWPGNLWKLRSYKHVPFVLLLLFRNMQ